jgi:AraC-like DNA-binding protein
LLHESGMSRGFGGRFEELAGIPAYAKFQGAAMEEMRSRIEEMYRESRSRERWRDTLLKAKLTETLVRFDRYRRPHQEAPEPVAPRTGRSAVRDVISYIHSNYQDELTLTGLARRYAFSVSRMSEVIKEATGQTFVKFVHDLRLRQAASLLASTDMSVMDIAHEVGFGSYKTFARMFKEAKGVAPTEFRKSRRTSVEPADLPNREASAGS